MRHIKFAGDARPPPFFLLRANSLMAKRSHVVAFLSVHQDYKCYRCKAPFDPDKDAFDIDHITRRVDGGSDETNNLCILCPTCHREKTALENRCGGSSLTREQRLRNHMRYLQSKKPEQVHTRYTVDHLRALWTSKKLKTAPLNRDPVWDERKQRSYVLTVIEGRITPPFFFNHLHGDATHIYDGVNRMNSLMRFMDGALYVQIGGMKVTYTPSTLADGLAMSDDERQYFRMRTLDVFEWSDLPESEACEIAQNINSGTPMSIGERVKLLCGVDTPRARTLKHIYEGEHFRMMHKNNREADLKALAVIVRHMMDGTYKCTSNYTNAYHGLKVFYSNPTPVDIDVVRTIQWHFRDIATLLASRDKTTRNLMIAHFGLSTPACDVNSALADGEASMTPERLVEKWTRDE